MRRRRPALAPILLLTLGGVLLVLLVARSLEAERAGSEQRFEERARITADLTAATLAATGRQAARLNADRLDGPRISRAQVDRVLEGSRATYAMVLGADGRRLAGTADAPDRPAGTARAGSPLRGVLGGEPAGWSEERLVDGEAIHESYTRFPTPEGPRVLVRAFRTALYADVLEESLRSLPSIIAGDVLVTDVGRDRLVAGFMGGRAIRGSVRDPALAAALRERSGFARLQGDRAISSARMPRSTWEVAIIDDEATVYGGARAWLSWLLVGAAVLAGGVAAILMVRMSRTKRMLRGAFEELGRQSEEQERINVELQRSNGELEQFASVASHDLQEPLRKVQAFGDVLERRFADDLPEDGRDYVRRMRAASARMSVLIEDLLRFSRVTTHAKPPRETDLAQVARDVTIDLQVAVEESGASVEIGELPVVVADPTQMRQLLQNLVGNALKFRRPDEPPRVEVRPLPAPEPGAVAFTVRDHGIGFEEAYAERIFRVFERLHPRDVYAGTGIGLALCRKIAERHGGTVTASSSPEDGTVFTVVLRTPAPGSPVASDERREALRA